jgi:MoaA/NifB/PqqE/SkfB family radical SAM enzyme
VPRPLPDDRHAAQQDVRVGFNTNGTFLTAEVAERLTRLGLDWLHVSVDGATKATYERAAARTL